MKIQNILPVPKCKVGYQQITGHIVGLGTISTIQKTSYEKCGEECDANPECNSYEYASTGLCQLNKESNPKEPKDWNRDIFCKGCCNSSLLMIYVSDLHKTSSYLHKQSLRKK